MLEGLYCNVDVAPWVTAAQQLDVRWVVEIQEHIARERLCERHVRTGVAKHQEEAEWRGEEDLCFDDRDETDTVCVDTADNNDLPNGRFLLAHVLEPAKRILSIDDPRWKGQE